MLTGKGQVPVKSKKQEIEFKLLLFDRSSRIIIADLPNAFLQNCTEFKMNSKSLFRSIFIDRPITKGTWKLRLSNEGELESEVILASWIIEK